MLTPTEKDLEGLGQTPIDEDFPTCEIAPCDELLNKDSSHNASIIIGRDRPAGLGTGYGKYAKNQGGEKSTTMDIVVGRYSYNKDNLKKSDKVGNHFQNDASRIYISQKTNIDENFLITEAGTLKSPIAKAAIGIKSDNIRIIGRESVKIVANPGERNSFYRKDMVLEKNNNVYGIQLITGLTNPNDVQGIVKDDNLRYLLSDLINKMDTILGTFHGFTTFQSLFNEAVAVHVHDGHFRSDIAGAVKILDPIELMNAYVKYSNDITTATYKDIDSIRRALKSVKNTYLNKASNKYIGSLYNKTN